MKKLLLVFMFFLASCASTSIRALKTVESRPPYPKKVVIVSANDDLENLAEIEKIFAKELDSTEMEGFPYLDLCGDIQCPEPQMEKIMDESGIDGSLVVIRKDMFHSDRFVSPNFYNMAIRSGWTDMPTAESSEGYDMSKRVYKYKVSLLDRKKRLIWTADCVTEGTTDRSIFKSLAQTVVKKLISYGITEK